MADAVQSETREAPARSAAAARFEPDQQVIHASHGVGRVCGWRDGPSAEPRQRYLVIDFASAGMVLQVPEVKLGSSGLRAVTSLTEMHAALAVLAQAPARLPNNWKQSSNEYLAKLNTGLPGMLAEVVRDLHRTKSAWSSKLFGAALARLAEELALVERIALPEAQKVIEAQLPALAA